MPSYPAIRDPNRCPTHPGELLKEDVLPAMDQSKAEVARMLGISRQHFYDILNQKKSVTPMVAARLGKLFGDGPSIWLRMQASYDAWHAEHEIDVSDVPTLVMPKSDKHAA